MACRESCPLDQRQTSDGRLLGCDVETATENTSGVVPPPRQQQISVTGGGVRRYAAPASQPAPLERPTRRVPMYHEQVRGSVRTPQRSTAPGATTGTRTSDTRP